MAALAQNLFRTSAFLNALSILGHVRFGFKTTYPALATNPSSTREHMHGMTSARVSYDSANVTLAIAALLNWQWSRTPLGPVTLEEQVVMWAVAVAGGLSSWRFTQAGMYGPLVCTFVAPICSLVGWWLS